MEPSILHIPLSHTIHNLEDKTHADLPELRLIFENKLQSLNASITYLKLSASTQMKRSDTKQKLQVHHMYIPSSQYPAHRDPRATRRQMFNKSIAKQHFFQMKKHLKDEISLTSAICTNICCGYCRNNTS